MRGWRELRWLRGGCERHIEVAGVDIGRKEFVPFGLGVALVWVCVLADGRGGGK